MTALLVTVGAVVGAPLRYLTDRFVQSRHDFAFPFGTLTVNAAGSLVLGVVAGAVAHGAPAWLATSVGTGFCGALTTFSTFAYETTRLVEDGSIAEAALNIGASLVIGFAACAGGWSLAEALA